MNGIEGFIKPKEIEIKDVDGNLHKFIISRPPAVAGREILAKYPLSNMPKLGEYEVSEEVMLKLIGYTAKVGKDGEPIRLSTRALIDNHVSDTILLTTLEYECINHAFGFFTREGRSGFLTVLVTMLVEKLSGTVIPLLQALSQQDIAPTKNSRKK